MSHGLVTDLPLTLDELLALRAQPVHVIGGASAEGIAVVRLLLALGFDHLTVHDMRERTELRKAFRTTHGAYTRVEQDELWKLLRPTLDAGCYGEHYLDGIADAALVVLGQGWYLDPANRARIVDAVPAAARITGMAALYFELHPGPIAAVTGTNGKSTTVALIEHLLQVAQVPHRTAGNERSSRQFLPSITELDPSIWALLEVSNRQLLQLAPAPDVAAITALTPDHLEEHGGFDGYQDTKARLFLGQSNHGVAIANGDDAEALAVAQRGPAARAGRLVACGIGERDGPSVAWVEGSLVARGVPVGSGADEVALAVASDMQMPGDHNLRNAAVAVAVALQCGADPSVIAGALQTFSGKSLRLQLLDSIDGIEVWSDLKSTTPEATVAALQALATRDVTLIMGGDDKGLDYAPLADAIRDSSVQVLAVAGTATDALEQALGAGLIDRVDGLAEALDRAVEHTVSGGCVIVSPAAAGFWTQQLQGSASLARLVRDRTVTALQEVTER